MNKADAVTKITFPFNTIRTIEDYNPSKITHIEQNILLESIYNPLLSSSEEGTFDFKIADSFEWLNENQIRFKIKSNLKSSKGDPITSEDVAISFKRTLIYTSNMHGSLKAMLKDCTLKTPFETCDSIQFDKIQNSITLTLKKKYFYLFTVLSSMDFSILPIKSLSDDGLKIIDYANTSGPFYISKFGNTILLKKNPYYKNNSPKDYFDEIEIIERTNHKQVMDEFFDKKINFIPPTFTFEKNQGLENFANSKKHVTSELLIKFIKFTKQGLKRTSLSNRAYLRQEISNQWKKTFSEAGYIFPDNIFDTINSLEIVKKPIQTVLPKTKIKIGVFSTRYYSYINIYPLITSAEFIKLDIKQFNNIPEEIDALLVSQDTSYDENMTHISFSVNWGVFGIFDEQASSWLDQFFNEESKVKRMKMIKELNQKAYDEVTYVALNRQPFYSFFQEDIEVDFPKQFSNSPLYKIYPTK